jgi:hypothetical protein
VVQWGLAYAAAMWGLLQGVEYFGETFEWSLYVRKLERPDGLRYEQRGAVPVFTPPPR